ncbi:hypothetical protein QBC32DRAFT_345476 [Pseudoneurospora amorphoporcata]|uniref:Uncharacterized protein n=1 Tax=Pseudoneurospora amorphoporcata TaxID=241081 RepID=A0AAN6NTK4_9PEZI|nr:hypothetical protein QBC32DRAFT_345476 [Pseudoneurospora amorphoporcata]
MFAQYGQGAIRTVNITGFGQQEAGFVDGLRFSMVARHKRRYCSSTRNRLAELVLSGL